MYLHKSSDFFLVKKILFIKNICESKAKFYFGILKKNI